MRENEPVLLVFSVCEEEIILEKGEILSEKRHRRRGGWEGLYGRPLSFLALPSGGKQRLDSFQQ
jgi:hypothetical protein